MERKRVVLVTLWSYPFGGGEAILRQTMKWNFELGYDSIWLSFSSQKNIPYQTLEIVKDDYGSHMHIPGGWDTEVLKRWVRFLNPRFIHHQGVKHLDVVRLASELSIPAITGFNFWHDAVKLQQPWGNVNIIEHYKDHLEDPDLEEILQKGIVYGASQFVLDVVKKISSKEIPHILYSTPSREDCVFEKHIPKYVTLINCHRAKGGEILLHLIRSLPLIPFMAVQTELLSEDLDAEIQIAMELQEAQTGVKSVFRRRVSDIREVLCETILVIAPSKCDETFHRVGVEAQLNGIPVLTSGHGNLVNIVSDNISGKVIHLDSLPEWVHWTNLLVNDIPTYTKFSNGALHHSKSFDEETARNQFKSMVKRTYKEPRVMHFTTWSVQGLGYQSKEYDKILRKVGIFSCILSYKSYFATPENPRNQTPDTEWLHPNIVYSSNNREEVSDEELVSFVQKFKVNVCLLPETVNSRVFNLAKLLRYMGVRVFAIPNVEIIRKDEVMLHEYFTGILCNNFISKRIFEERGLSRTNYLGYGVNIDNFRRNPRIPNVTRFLSMGGMNAFTRKQIDVVVKAAVLTFDKLGGGLSVTVTIQSGKNTAGYGEISGYEAHPAVTIITDVLSSNAVNELYENTDVYCMISEREGLGMGFYKPLEYGLPVVTVDTDPHREIIKDGINGFIVDCEFEAMTDNIDGFVKNAITTPEKLACVFEAVVKKHRDITAWNDFQERLFMDAKERLSYEKFSSRLIEVVKIDNDKI